LKIITTERMYDMAKKHDDELVGIAEIFFNKPFRKFNREERATLERAQNLQDKADEGVVVYNVLVNKVPDSCAKCPLSSDVEIYDEGDGKPTMYSVDCLVREETMVWESGYGCRLDSCPLVCRGHYEADIIGDYLQNLEEKRENIESD
jgi:hypothetical protein